MDQNHKKKNESRMYGAFKNHPFLGTAMWGSGDHISESGM